MTVIVESPEASPPQVAEATTNENDVAIAAIEAERDVAIAVTHAEARVEEAGVLAEAQTEQAENREDIAWRMSHLEEQQNRMMGMLETLTTQTQVSLTPPSLEEVTGQIVEEVSETLEASSLTPNNTADETSEMQTEAGLGNVEENQEVEVVLPPLLEVGRKPIIKLV